MRRSVQRFNFDYSYHIKWSLTQSRLIKTSLRSGIKEFLKGLPFKINLLWKPTLAKYNLKANYTNKEKLPRQWRFFVVLCSFVMKKARHVIWTAPRFSLKRLQLVVVQFFHAHNHLWKRSRCIHVLFSMRILSLMPIAHNYSFVASNAMLTLSFLEFEMITGMNFPDVLWSFSLFLLLLLLLLPNCKQECQNWKKKEISENHMTEKGAIEKEITSATYHDLKCLLHWEGSRWAVFLKMNEVVN